MRGWFAASLMLVLPAAAGATEPDRLVTIKPGTLPIILSAPHGGRTAIADVPVRVGQNVPQFATVRDENTHELAERIAGELQQRLRGRPFLVAARFDRKHVDPNRPEHTALESDKARPYYRAYHQALQDFSKDVQKKWTRGLLLDIHGQGAVPGAILRGTNDGQSTHLLIQRYGRAALTGPRSLLGRVAAAGLLVSPPVDSEEREDRRFSGGYIVRAYGSHQGHGIDAIQLEFGLELRRSPRLAKTASVVAEAIEHYCQDYLPEALRTTR